MINLVTYETVRHDPAVSAYIKMADEAMRAIGYTEHSFAHVAKTATGAADILSALNYPERTVELSKIAGYLHDIGNVVNRHDHAQSGAIMAFSLLSSMGMPPEEIAAVISAIGNHDEDTGAPINEIAAALILADKGDVRRSRVRKTGDVNGDIHDRVNYAVTASSLYLDKEKRLLSLILSIDTDICAVMDYFEIFLGRMLLCRKAADFFGLHFNLIINGVTLL